MKDFMDRVHLVKIDEEVKNMKVAAGFVNWTFSELINEVEDIIDGEKSIKHSLIQKKIEGNLEKDVQVKNFMKKFPNVQSSFLEYPIPILIQSGQNFNLNKFNVQSD